MSREEWQRWHTPQPAVGGLAVVAALEYCPATRRVQPRLRRPRCAPSLTAPHHAWQQ